MPKIYQLIKGNPYVLPENLYRQVLYLIKDYDRIKLLWEEELYTTPRNEFGPRGSSKSDPTFSKAARRIRLEEDLRAMDKAMSQIPDEYREHVINHARYGIRFPDWADRKTWFKYQSKYIFHVAENLKKV